MSLVSIATERYRALFGQQPDPVEFPAPEPPATAAPTEADLAATRARRADYQRAATRHTATPAQIARPRPTPTPGSDAHLSPWERAWNQLTDDERAWSSQ